MWVIGFSLLAGATVVAAGVTSDVSGNPITRLFAHTEQPLREYLALRRMHASSASTSKYDAWLEARTALKDGRFSYEIVSERGSDTVRSKVLRAILEREQALINGGDGTKGDLTPDNYDFSEAGRDTDGSRVVQMKPRRSDVLLVDGRAVLNDRGELVRIEGRLSKNPSFWTSLVNVIRRYARIGGVRVPVATETTAKIKFVGTAQLTVAYDYQSVNGRPVAITERYSSSEPAHSAGQSDSSDDAK